MSTLNATVATLLDFAKRLDPGTQTVTTTIAEMLSQENSILQDALFKEGNLPTGHRLTMRTGLPSVTWRKLNQGIAPSKSTTAQVDEGCGILEQLSQVDKNIADLAGNPAAYRLSESKAALAAMNNEVAQTLFYGDHTTAPEEFLGLAPRYSTISGATNGQNVITGSGSGSDNTSIWLVNWGENTVHCIFPKGSKVGLQHSAKSEAEWCFDSSNNRFMGYLDHFQWQVGLALPDWRNVVRIPNIDVSNLVADSSAADLIKLMSRAIDRLPSTESTKPVFYVNRTVFSMLKIQALGKSSSALSVQDALNQFGKSFKELSFLGIPIRRCDALLNTESTIS